MKGGNLAVSNSRIRQYIAQQQARLHTEAIITHASDFRQTYAQLNAGNKTDVTIYAGDAATLTPSAITGISHTAGTDDNTDLNSARPYSLMAWALDESVYGPDVRLSKVQCYLDNQRNTSNEPFDGAFVLRVFRIANYFQINASPDLWQLVEVASSIAVKSSSIAAPGLVDFAFSTSAFGNTPSVVPIDDSFRPAFHRQLTPQGAFMLPPSLQFTGRVLVIRLDAFGGTNSNYSWKYESGASNPETVASKGLLYSMSGATPTSPLNLYASGPLNVQVSAATGIPRATFTVNAYAATGELEFTDVDLGTAPAGTIEFRVLAEVPVGCTGLAEASDDGGANWSTVTDGCTPAEASPALTAQQTYQMRYSFTADGTLSATPVLRQLGVVDRTLLDLTEFASWSEPQESVDPLTAAVKIADAECRLQFTGQRDYLDDVTTMLASYNWDGIELRTHVYHPDLARSEWGFLDLWSLDTPRIDGSEAVLSCISLLSKLRGKYPRSAGSQYGYLLKSTASDLTGLGGDFQKEISSETQATSSVTWTVAAGATENAYFVTPASVPNISRWMAGPWLLNINITSGASDIKLSAVLLRYNSAGALQETQPKIALTTSQEITASTGAKTLSFSDIAWAAGAAGDRLVVKLQARNTDGGASHAITFETGTTATEIRPPWIMTAAVSPQMFENVSAASAAATWLDTVIALPARYRGALSDRSEWTIRKAVMDADGQRELERISYLDGLTVIASQGRIKQVNLWGTRGLAVASFPMETYQSGTVDMGFGARLPEYDVPFGFETNIPGDFGGNLKAQHVAAFTAFGRAKIDEPVPELDHDTAKYVKDAGLAGEIARGRVLSDGCGDMRIAFAPTEWCPWLEIGDDAIVETDRLAFRDPVNGLAIRGPLWARGVIIAKSGDLMPRFVLKVLGLADLFVTSDTVQQRAPYEGPQALPFVDRDPASLANAKVRIRAYPPSATIYYAAHDLADDPPSRGQLQLWSVYSDVVTVARDASSDRLFSCFAEYNGFTGAIRTVRIQPDETAQVLSLTAVQDATASPNTIVTARASVDADTRSVRFYWRKDSAGTAWPTVDGTQSAAVSETYFKREVHVSEDGGGIYADGSPSQGGDLTTDGDSGSGSDLCASTNYVQVIAVAKDYNGNVGTRAETSYDVAASAGPHLTSTTRSSGTDHGASCSTPRDYDLSWSGSGLVDGTHTLSVYCDVDGQEALIYSTGNPASASPANGVDINAYGRVGEPDITARFRYELTVTAGGAVLDSGAFGSGPDTFQGQGCDI